MAVINVIPEVSSFAVAVGGEGGQASRVDVYNGEGDALMASLIPFADFKGELKVAMGDVNGDQVLDLVVAPGPGGEPRIKAYSGKATGGSQPFQQVIQDFLAFEPTFRGGVSLAVGGIEGTGLGANIIAGTGSGRETQVKVFRSSPSQAGSEAAVFSSFSPYPGFQGGVNVAAGMVDLGSGRVSIITAPGTGHAPEVKTFLFDLYRANGSLESSASAAPQPQQTASFMAFNQKYTGGLSIATGWVAGKLGGYQRIIVGKQAGSPEVKVFSSGSRLNGHPAFYTDSPNATAEAAYIPIASFNAFPGESSDGVRVSATSTVVGADLLVGNVTKGNRSKSKVLKLDLERSAASPLLVPKVLDRVFTAPEGIISVGGA